MALKDTKEFAQCHRRVLQARHLLVQRANDDPRRQVEESSTYRSGWTDSTPDGSGEHVAIVHVGQTFSASMSGWYPY
jgi:hypothetical protein